MGVVTYGGGYLYGVPVITVGWAENDYQDTDRSLAVLLSMDSTTHGVPVRHSEELAKGENRDLYKEEVMQKLLVYISHLIIFVNYCY